MIIQRLTPHAADPNEKTCSNLNAIIHSKFMLKINEKSLTINPKLFQNPSNIDKNDARSRQMCHLIVFGAKSRPGRLWGGFRTNAG